MDGWCMNICNDAKPVSSVLCVHWGGSLPPYFIFTSVPPGCDQQFPVLESSYGRVMTANYLSRVSMILGWHQNHPSLLPSSFLHSV